MPAIVAENLSKVFRVARKDPGVAGAVKALFRPRYTKKVAVDGVSFTVEPGEMVGYIGVNGAGKSTTIKMLTGILAPSDGSVRVLGRDPQRQFFVHDRLPRLAVWLAALPQHRFITYWQTEERRK